MSIGVPSQPHERFVHEAVYFASAEQLVQATAPSLRQALVDGEDVALVCSEAHNLALLEALGHDERVHVLPRPAIYTKAVTAVGYFRDFLTERVTAGTTRVCVLGEVDFGDGLRAHEEWRRYEALLNHALRPFPVWSLCGYDTRVLDDSALVTAERTHPFLRHGGRRTPNPGQVDPGEVLRRADADRSPAPDGDASLTVEVEDLGEVRRQVQEALLGARLSGSSAEDLVIAIHELAINGVRHGGPPVTLRLWVLPGSVQCTVTDRGPGIDDPFVGYLRGGGDELPEGGFGLWLARQLCDEVALYRTPEGFTARVVVDR